MFAACLVLLRREQECRARKFTVMTTKSAGYCPAGCGSALPDEKHELTSGEAIQFDAILHHTYEALENCEVVVIHLRKGKRF